MFNSSLEFMVKNMPDRRHQDFFWKINTVKRRAYRRFLLLPKLGL